jgi:hypothetical protein
MGIDFDQIAVKRITVEVLDRSQAINETLTNVMTSCSVVKTSRRHHD